LAVSRELVDFLAERGKDLQRLLLFAPPSPQEVSLDQGHRVGEIQLGQGSHVVYDA
jgi:hypothetical protein